LPWCAVSSWSLPVKSMYSELSRLFIFVCEGYTYDGRWYGFDFEFCADFEIWIPNFEWREQILIYPSHSYRIFESVVHWPRCAESRHLNVCCVLLFFLLRPASSSVLLFHSKLHNKVQFDHKYVESYSFCNVIEFPC
jgi:hypothetical protein